MLTCAYKTRLYRLSTTPRDPVQTKAAPGTNERVPVVVEALGPVHLVPFRALAGTVWAGTVRPAPALEARVLCRQSRDNT
eukprot:3796683-Rhodomonas_salina.1